MSCSVSASRIIGIPALVPVCARTGMLVKATAPAAATAMARKAGLDGRALLGGRATIMRNNLGLSVRVANYGWNELGSTRCRPWADYIGGLRSSPTKAAECGITGAGARGKIG